MNHTAYFTALKENKLPPCLLFEGEEEYIKRQALKSLEESLLPAGLEQMNETRLNNPDADTLIAACDTLPFMSEKRLVVVFDCDLVTTGKKSEDDGKAEEILSYLDRQSPECALVFYVTGKANGTRKLYTRLKKQNAIVTFARMSEAEAVSWLIRSFRKMGKSITNIAAQAMHFQVGSDAALLRQEMDKLAAYVGDREAITEEDVAAVCVRSLECTVFQMVDAQVAGNMDEAFSLLRSMLLSGEDRMGIQAMLLRQYRILYHCRALYEENAPQSEYASLLGIPPFAVGRTLAQAKRYELKKLKEAYEALYQSEFAVKSGVMPVTGALEHAMLGVSAILR